MSMAGICSHSAGPLNREATHTYTHTCMGFTFGFHVSLLQRFYTFLTIRFVISRVINRNVAAAFSVKHIICHIITWLFIMPSLKIGYIGYRYIYGILFFRLYLEIT